MEPNWLNESEWISRYRAGISPLQGHYLGFYSSIIDGFFRESWGFWVPLDDHLVHRGDGIFEAVRVQDRAFFDLDSHLARLSRSAEKVALNLPFSIVEIRQRCIQLAKLCNVEAAVLRLYVSRGPGGFTQNPYEPKKSQLYLALTAWKGMPVAWYESGVRAGISRVPGKRPFEATIKSCNYLQNVLQKKDAVDRGLEFSVCLNEASEVLEGSTESFCMVTEAGELLIPSTEITLLGTTLAVTRRLAEEMVAEGMIKSIRETRFRTDLIAKAREIAFVGTTIGVCPVTTWESKPVGDGRPGPVCRELGRRLETAMRTRADLRTSF